VNGIYEHKNGALINDRPVYILQKKTKRDHLVLWSWRNEQLVKIGKAPDIWMLSRNFAVFLYFF
jgi:hypothetical protein